jgi:hypothetical protein
MHVAPTAEESVRQSVMEEEYYRKWCAVRILSRRKGPQPIRSCRNLTISIISIIYYIIKLLFTNTILKLLYNTILHTIHACRTDGRRVRPSVCP